MSESQFPKMGEHPLEGSVVNMSGNRSPYTMPVERKGPSADGEAEPAGKRGVTMATGERNGPCFRPQATICYPNAPESGSTGRGMRTVPSRTGNQDFWDNRASQSGEVI